MSFEYKVVHSKRRSIGILITPDLKVIVRTPLKVNEKFLNELIKQKTPWILKKLNFFKANVLSVVENETYILGKKCKIKHVTTQGEAKILLNKKTFDNIEELQDVNEITVQAATPDLFFAKWIFSLAERLFAEILEKCYQKFNINFKHKKPLLIIKKLKSRWGSLSSSGKMTLNVHLIKTSKDCIEYVIMHELCHLEHQNHGKNFHKLEEHFVPNRREMNFQLKKFGGYLKIS